MKMQHQAADRAPRWDDVEELPARPNSLQEIADLAAKITGASGATVALEKPSGEIVCAARCGECAPAVGAVVNRSRGISAVCVRSSAVQHCADTDTDPRVDAEVCRQLGIRSILVMPLRRNGRVAGLLSIYSDSASKFDHRDVARLKYVRTVAAGFADAEEAKAPLAPELVVDRLPRKQSSTKAAEPKTVSPPCIEATVIDGPQLAKSGAESPPADLRVHVSAPGAEELAGWLQPRRSAPRSRALIIALGMIAMAALALAGLRFAGTRRGGSAAQLAPPVAVSETPPPAPSRSSDLPAPPQRGATENSLSAGAAPVAETGVGHVQSIESSVGAGYARVTIGLDRNVPFNAFRLDRPERVYFDLRNTRFAPGARPQTIAVAGPALFGIRSSQYAPDVVRVVLDLSSRAAYSAAFRPDPPRLVIEVDSGRNQPLRTADSPAPSPRPSVDAGAASAPKSR
jgi:hypothetical protein